MNLILKKTLILSLLFCTCFAIAQVGRKKITVNKIDGSQLQCSARNLKFNSEPQTIVCYINKELKPQMLELDSVASIQYKKKMFIIAEVEFDNSTNNYQKLDERGEKSNNKFFYLEKRKLYLQVLVDEKLRLYKSRFNDNIKFFMDNKEGVVIPLLYKRYYIPRPSYYMGHDFAKENNFYRQQLLNEAPCRDKKGRLVFPEYKELSLVAHFKKLNDGKCN